MPGLEKSWLVALLPSGDCAKTFDLTKGPNYLYFYIFWGGLWFSFGGCSSANPRSGIEDEREAAGLWSWFEK